MSLDLTDRVACNRFRLPEDSKRGHYESYFQRANHPDRPLAFWIRYTVFRPAGRPGDAIGELWAIWFDGESGTTTAVKHEEPLARCWFDPDHLQVDIAGSKLDDSGLEGGASSSGHEIRWRLEYGGGDRPLLLLPKRLYSTPLPKAKALVGTPNAIYKGTITVDGQEHAIDDWVGSQNHNWGSKHTDYYAWGQVAGFDGVPGSFLECGSAKLKLGPIWTPMMTVMVLRLDGEEHRLNGLPQSFRASESLDYFDWHFCSCTPDVQIEGRIHAPRHQFVGLTYYNPPGGSKSCLNSKLASCEVTLTRKGRPPVTLKSQHRAAFEILTDDPNHGVPMVA